MSPQSASRGPVERVYVAVSLARETYVPTAGEGGLGRTSDDFVPSLEFQVGSCLYVTAAVRAGSLRASRTWLSLSFLLSSLSFPSSLGVPGCFRHSWEPFPLLLWCVPGRLCHSWEHLPPLSFLLFLFLFPPLPPVRTLVWVATRGSWPSY